MTQPTSVGGAYNLGQVTGDFSGSRQEWEERVIADLINRYKHGEGGAGGYGDGSIGQPSAADFGNPEKPLSFQTVQYWENYVKKFGASDPDIVGNYGAPPGRNTSYEQDPNSPASIQGTWDQRNKAAVEESAKDRQLERDLEAGRNSRNAASEAAATARTAMQEAGATQRTSMQIEGSWREAQLADATRRYVAEGDWGIQKWVTTENNTAAMARLQMQLGFDREALAQQAITEKNRHHEQMVGLALEVAKYDAELAASPRNWLKYAGWLQARNIVVNGMTLAMAAQEVPEQSIEAGTVANATGDNLAGLEVQAELASGQSGGAASSQNAFGADTVALTGAEGTAGANVNVQQQGTMGAMQPTLSPEQLAGATDYGALAQQLLGMNPLAPTEADTSPQNLQNIANNLNTTNRPKVASFGAYQGPTTNALGIDVGPEVSGQNVDYRQFSSLLPTEQQMKVGAVESVRGSAGVSDWVKEMEMSRPKGGGSSLAWG